MADKNTIKNWFKTGLKPSQAQFWAWIDSYWHKDELIPIIAIDGIESILDGKADAEALANHIAAKGEANGYAPLNELVKIASEYLTIVDDLLTGGATSLLSAEQGKVLKGQIDAINLLLTSDDVNLDTVQELVDAIKEVEISLSSILVNDIVTGGVTKALTAEQGKVLKIALDALTITVSAIPVGVVTTVKSILSTALATQNVAGMVDYINALTPVLVVANNEIVKYLITDTGRLFELNLRGRSFGVGQTAITDSNILEISSGVVNTITINTAVSIDTNTTVSGNVQQGKNVKISNGATAINLTCLSTSSADFVASYTKIGTSTITFLAGTGTTLVVMGGGLAVLNGAIGSSALLTRHGNTYYLQLNNY